MDRAPNLPGTRKVYPSSVSVSSHRIICAVRKHAPEKAESRWMRAPTSGLIVARRSPQNNLIVFGESDPKAVGSVDGNRPFRDELRTSSKNKLLPSVRTRRLGAIVSNPRCREASARRAALADAAPKMPAAPAGHRCLTAVTGGDQKRRGDSDWREETL